MPFDSPDLPGGPMHDKDSLKLVFSQQEGGAVTPLQDRSVERIVDEKIGNSFALGNREFVNIFRQGDMAMITLRDENGQEVSKPFAEWKDESEKADKKGATKRIGEVRAELNIPPIESAPALENKEDSREQIINNILNTGHFVVNGSFSRELSEMIDDTGQFNSDRGLETDGFKTISQSGVVDNRLGYIFEGAHEKLGEQGCAEYVSFSRDQKTSFREEDEEVVVKPGTVFGIGRQTETRKIRVPSGTEQAMMSDVVYGGNNQAAGHVEYSVFSTPDKKWSVPGETRSGQNLSVKIILPLSEVKTLETIVKNDPAILRELSRRVLSEKFFTGDGGRDVQKATQDLEGLNPPLQTWYQESSGKGSIYIQGLEDSLQSGFRPENLVNIKKP